MPPRPREDTDPPVLPTEDLSGIFAAPGHGGSLVGSIVAGRYTVTELIGTGGMGAVYRVFDAAEQRDVALKVLKPDRVGEGHNVKRFMQEARVLSMLSHPNVVRLYDYGQDENGVLYLAMEMLPGQDLADYLGDYRQLPWTVVSEIALQLVQGLAAAHQRGIVHRDLKPENVFLVPGPRGGPQHQVKLLDFGIAKVISAKPSKLTTEGSVFGTARYMSPEHASGEPVDARSDVYGVGVLLYEMLTGRPPFTGDDFMRTAHQHVAEPPPPMAQVAPEVIFPPHVEALIMRALAKDPADRYGSMADFEAAIQSSMFDSDSTMAMVLPTLPDEAPPDEPEFEQTVIKSMPLPPPPAVGRMPPPEERTVIKPAPRLPPERDRGARRVTLKPELPADEPTVVRSAPAFAAAPAPVPVDDTVAIRRPDPAPVGGTMIIAAPAPPGLPDYDDQDLNTMVHQRRAPPAALPNPKTDPQMAPPMAHHPARQVPPPSIASLPSARAPRSAPGRGFVAEDPPVVAPFASASPQERPVFAREQNEGLMFAGLAPQRLSSPAAVPLVPDAQTPNPEDLLRKPFNGGQWTTTEKTSATEYPEDYDGGDMLLRPPAREISRNLLVAIIILSVLGLATITFVLWQTLREEPEYSVAEPHPAAVTEQPRPALFEPPPPEAPAFEEEEEEEEDDDEPDPDPEPRDPKPRPTKVVTALSKGQIDDGFKRAQSAIDSCASQYGGLPGISVTVSFDVVDSRARNAKPQTPHNATPLGKCIAAAVNANARFAKSKQPSLAIMRKVVF
ncbi:MAG: protein kinase [Nannocystaceae bacterium]